ncbi:ATP-binding protein [Thermoleptolyngbya sp. C42_A2020_037]|uniref:ATP-binding response regulator n=1 Tax=Thermoleptolyngbya sp. C42_A2020_037 TaxID=2747799 RepID=UPI001A0083B0|nr:ATP-binding protein [Thermoleptolyngbya sp. C42_A2020_037]MBF2083686.1 response regulator [Thermoleptolyngbya sp. C42_A2020_037]
MSPASHLQAAERDCFPSLLHPSHMPTPEPSVDSLILPLAVLHQLQDLLQQMALWVQSSGDGVLLLGATTLPLAVQTQLPDSEQFMVLVSRPFSVLLSGWRAQGAGGSGDLDAAERLQRVDLTFEPGAIATFLQSLMELCQAEADLTAALQAAGDRLQPNDPLAQTEFTRRLVALLTNPELSIKPERSSLEQQVVARTHDLQEAVLAAQTANRAKSEFLAAVSHELRTPLTTIIGMSATLLRWSLGELSPRQRSFLQTIHDSGQHLLELINDILDLSQVESGRAVLELSPFSLTMMAQQSMKAIEETALKQGVELVLDLRIDPSRDRFVADPHRVKQILLNLLSNAVKFTAAGGKVTLRVMTDPQHAIFQVIDTGIGIPEQQRPLLFQKFQQLDSSYQRLYQGTGLGLALTKQLVDLHGGRIMVDSTVGVGSVFTVQLPARSKDDAAEATAPIPALDGLGRTILGRVVLVENDELTANIICDMLTAAGYQVVWVLEGSTAFSQIELLQPDAVIVDVQSPENAGAELIHNLRHSPITQHLKVIALASDEASPYAAPAIAAADSCITKPIQPEDVLPRVLSLVAIAETS